MLLLMVVEGAPATQYLNPYPDIYEPVRKTMVVSQFPSRSSNRPYTPIFENQEGGGRLLQQQQQLVAAERRQQEQQQDEDDFDGEFDGEQFGGPEGLQFLW